MRRWRRLSVLLWFLPALSFWAPRAQAAATPCANGSAGQYSCEKVDLEAFLPLDEIGGGTGNDIWGWTDPMTGKEYALMGRSNGTAFVDVSDPDDPIYLGNLPTVEPHGHDHEDSFWRDIKVYADYAFIVSEAETYGMQVFDLTLLRHVQTPPVTFEDATHYDNFGNAHNIVINEETGFAYAVGSNSCEGGLHMIDIADPVNPTFAGCFADDGYTHDAQCVVYRGPDVAHEGREICFAYNTDTLTIVDVTDKGSPVQLSRSGYDGSAYTHQGWLTEDHTVVLMNDERDETELRFNTRTLIWDVSDLDAPVHVASYHGPTRATDHNLYIADHYAFASNYTSGLRILSLCGTELTEVAHFDTYPANDDVELTGTWSNYPFFESGTVVVTGIQEGLFVLRPDLPPTVPNSASYEVCAGESVSLDAGEGFAEYRWPSGETTRTVRVAPGATTTYPFEVVDATGCLRGGTAQVNVKSAPTPSITPADPVLCEGESLTLDAGEGFAEYSWSSGETTRTIEVAPDLAASPAVYDVTVTGTNDCPGSDRSTVTVVPLQPTTMGNVLKAAKADAGILHVWRGMASAMSYGLVRSGTRNMGSPVEVVRVQGRTFSWLEADALANPSNHFDRVSAMTCER